MFKRFIKPLLPTNLFGRALLILLVPIVLLQLLVAHIFFDRHWDSVVRNMSTATAADVAVLVNEYERVAERDGHEEAAERIAQLGDIMAMTIEFLPGDVPVINGVGADRFPEFMRSLDVRLRMPVMAEMSKKERIRVRVALGERTLELRMSPKRLVSSTTYIFIFWMFGSSLLLVLIAGLFLRNQVRPIVQLARAAEQFGLGRDVTDFSPRGANEIRRAGRAFVIMADRIRRQVASRTEMLAGISHDLRTPLTRMKLEIEMGKLDTATAEALNADIDEMRRMIDEYLDFARGDASEPMEPMDLAALVKNICQQYTRQGENVSITDLVPVTLMVRPQAMRRALANLVENALRYGGGTARLALEQTVAYVRIRITDEGPGIPEEEHETVFKPFTRLEPSRNIATGGVGLGLSIARDIAQSHGGDITIENQRNHSGNITGLEVTLRLPREVRPVS